MTSKIDKPYVLRVAELIYSKIIEIKNQNPEINNIQAFEIFMTTKDYDFISSGEFHDNWISELKDNDFISTVAHEMVHVWQYATKQLTQKGCKEFWRGKDYTDEYYSKQPWERQAYRMEESILKEYKRDTKT